MDKVMQKSNALLLTYYKQYYKDVASSIPFQNINSVLQFISKLDQISVCLL